MRVWDQQISFRYRKEVEIELDKRHGQGAWGGAYPKGPEEALTILRYGDWYHAYDFQELSGNLQPDDSAGWIGDAFEPDGTPEYGARGVLGYADRAVICEDPDQFVAENTTLLDIGATIDLGIVVASRSFPVIEKYNGSNGWAVSEHTSAFHFHLDDGADTVDMTINPSPLTYAQLAVELAKGCITIAALSRSTNMARVGVVLADGRVFMSALTSTATIGSLTVAQAATFSFGPAEIWYSHAMFTQAVAGSATGLPENLEASLRAYHARLFPQNARMAANVTAISDDTTAADNLEIQFDGTGYVHATAPATQAALDAVDDLVDTEVAAILAAVDTEIAAIKAITDQIQFNGGLVRVRVDGYNTGMTPLQPTVAGRTLDVTATGAGGIDWGNVENVTTTINFTNTTIKEVTDVSSALVIIDNFVDGLESAVDALPTAAEIDTQLSGTHGAGAWGGGSMTEETIAAEVLAEILAYSHAPSTDIDGLLARLEALMTGELVVTEISASELHYEWRLRGGGVAFEGSTDRSFGSREESAI